MKIVGQDGGTLPPAEVGEVLVRPRYEGDTFIGYWRMPEATAAVHQDGWFRMGDRGWLDGEGFFYFSDRSKDSIKRRGENVSTFEVERALLSFPGIKRVAVVGHRPAPAEEEEVRALLELDPGAGPIDHAALVAHCARNLAYFMVPRFIEVVPTLPLNAIGKVEKYKLAGRALASNAFDLKATGILLER
jgi:crotonobetaine/carnitine-CoA ligase